MGELMNIFIVREHGIPVFEGGIDQTANLLKVSKSDIYDAVDDETLVRGRYTVEKKTEEEIRSDSLQEHLFNPDGTRRYEYKKNFPNRYKDASSRRFTPM